MRGALEGHQPVDRLRKVVTIARNVEGDTGDAPADRTVPSSSGTLDKLDTMWDNSPDWDNSTM